METSGIFETTFKALENNLDLRTKKHSLITSNVANMDTPNYKSFNFKIDEAMERETKKITAVELKQTDGGHMKTNSNTASNMRLNGVMKEEKDIDVDKMMMDLSQNSILYNAAAQILSKKYRLLKASINGGQS